MTSKKRNFVERLESRILLSGDGLMARDMLAAGDNSTEGKTDGPAEEFRGENDGETANSGDAGRESEGEDRPVTQPVLPGGPDAVGGPGSDGAGSDGGTTNSDDTSPDDKSGDDSDSGEERDAPPAKVSPPVNEDGGDDQDDSTDKPVRTRPDRSIVLVRQDGTTANRVDAADDSSDRGGNDSNTTTTNTSGTANRFQAAGVVALEPASGSDTDPPPTSGGSDTIINTISVDDVRVVDDTDAEKTDNNDERPKSDTTTEPADSNPTSEDPAKDDETGVRQPEDSPAAPVEQSTPVKEDGGNRSQPAPARANAQPHPDRPDANDQSAAPRELPRSSTAAVTVHSTSLEASLDDGNESLQANAGNDNEAGQGRHVLPVVSGALLAVTLGQPLSRLTSPLTGAADGRADGEGPATGAPSRDQKRRERSANANHRPGRNQDKEDPRDELEDDKQRPRRSSNPAQGNAVAAAGISTPLDIPAISESPADQSATPSQPASAVSGGWGDYSLLAIASSGVMAGSLSMLALGRNKRLRSKNPSTLPAPSFTGETVVRE